MLESDVCIIVLSIIILYMIFKKSKNCFTVGESVQPLTDPSLGLGSKAAGLAAAAATAAPAAASAEHGDIIKQFDPITKTTTSTQMYDHDNDGEIDGMCIKHHDDGIEHSTNLGEFYNNIAQMMHKQQEELPTARDQRLMKHN